MIIRPSLSGSLEKSVPPPLDIDGMPSPRLAYSLRKLRSGYTGAALRVRRGSDNTEADVYFYNQKEVTLNSMTSSGDTLQVFIGGETAFVTKWYNQSAETTKPDAVQTTTGRQPELISSGTFNNGIKFVTTGGFSAYGDYFQVNSYRLPNTDDNHTLLWMGRIFAFSTGGGAVVGLITNLDNFNDGAEMIAGINGTATNGDFRLAVDSHDEDSSSHYPANKNTICIGSYDRTRSTAQGGAGTSQIVRVNGNQTTKNTNEDKHVGRTDRFRIGCRKISNNPLNGSCKEVMVWESFVSLALQEILEKNIAIYHNTDLTNDPTPFNK